MNPAWRTPFLLAKLQMDPKKHHSQNEATKGWDLSATFIIDGTHRTQHTRPHSNWRRKVISFYESDTKQQSMDRREGGSCPHLKPSSDKSLGKRMALIFWDWEGILLCKWLEEEMSTGQYYSMVLDELREEIKQKRSGKLATGVLLQQDNFRLHTCH